MAAGAGEHRRAGAVVKGLQRAALAAALALTAFPLYGVSQAHADGWIWCGDPGRAVGDGCVANIQGDAVDQPGAVCQLSWVHQSGQVWVSTQASTDSGCEQARQDCASYVQSLVALNAGALAIPREALRCPWAYETSLNARLETDLELAEQGL